MRGRLRNIKEEIRRNTRRQEERRREKEWQTREGGGRYRERKSESERLRGLFRKGVVHNKLPRESDMFEIGGVPTTPDLILLQKYRHTNGSHIVIQIGGLPTFCQEDPRGHTFAKVSRYVSWQCKYLMYCIFSVLKPLACGRQSRCPGWT